VGLGQGLFKLPVDEAGALLRAAKDVLDSWYAAYMQARLRSPSPDLHRRWPACAHCGANGRPAAILDGKQECRRAPACSKRALGTPHACAH